MSRLTSADVPSALPRVTAQLPTFRNDADDAVRFLAELPADLSGHQLVAVMPRGQSGSATDAFISVLVLEVLTHRHAAEVVFVDASEFLLMRARRLAPSSQAHRICSGRVVAGGDLLVGRSAEPVPPRRHAVMRAIDGLVARRRP